MGKNHRLSSSWLKSVVLTCQFDYRPNMKVEFLKLWLYAEIKIWLNKGYFFHKNHLNVLKPVVFFFNFLSCLIGLHPKNDLASNGKRVKNLSK